MESQEISKEVQTAIAKLIQTTGVEKIEFSITPQMVIRPAEKYLIWFDLSAAKLKQIYKDAALRYILPYDEELTGQYLYIKIKL